MKTFLQALPKLTLGLLLASGVTGAVVASAQPAQAGVVISVRAGGYAAPYHWYRWHDGYGWHRQWVRVGWVPPVGYAPAYFYRTAYVRPQYWRYDRDHDRDRNHRDWR